MLITDTIDIKTRNVKVSLRLSGPKVIIEGDTASGKSFIVKTLEGAVAENKINRTNKAVYLDHIEIFNYKRTDLSVIKGFKNKLIVIDDADLLFNLNSDYIDIINQDNKNQYIIMGRFLLGLRVLPKYIGHLERRVDRGRIVLEIVYRESER